MAASDDRPKEAVTSQTDEKWVLVRDGGDAAKELLLQEEHGDARGGKEFLRWCHSAWNDILARNNTGDDVRLYILAVAISANTVLRLLAPLESLVECEILQAILTFLGKFTMGVLCSAAFSYATRFLSLLAAKASVVKKVEVNALLFGLLGTTALTLMAGWFAGMHDIVTGLKVSSKAGRGTWYLQLPVTVLRLPAFIGAIGSLGLAVILMQGDVTATFDIVKLHWRETKEARTVFTKRWLHPLKPVLLTALLTVVAFFVIIGTVVILVVFGVIPDPAAQAATRAI
ncbi:hypothetical protein MTO96_025543 [Rhipicephalus appendiculatus]